MNNLIVNLKSTDTDLSEARKTIPSLKFIVFGMGELNLALRIESVHKVVNHAPVYSSGSNHIGVTHLADTEVTVVDLHKRFFKSSLLDNSEQKGYLVIVKNTVGELYGIPVVETPTLIEVPSTMIRVLPESYRRADTLEVASHVAVIPQAEATLTIFLLDVDLLLPIFQESKLIPSAVV